MRPCPLPVSREQLCAALRTTPVRIVAARYGLKPTTLRVWRVRWGIPAYRFHQAGPHAARVDRLLTLLAQHPDGLTQRQCAAALGVTKQAISEMVRRLCARGWVEKTAARRGARQSPVTYRLAAGRPQQEG